MVYRSWRISRSEGDVYPYGYLGMDPVGHIEQVSRYEDNITLRYATLRSLQRDASRERLG